MTRDTAFWITVAGSTFIPGAIVGLLSGRHLSATYVALTKELQSHGVELTSADCQLLLHHLRKAPERIVSTETRPEVRAIKQRHIEDYLPRHKTLRRLYWLVLAIALISFATFQTLWPNR